MAKREAIAPNGDKRYIRRDDKGRIATALTGEGHIGNRENEAGVLGAIGGLQPTNAPPDGGEVDALDVDRRQPAQFIGRQRTV